VQNRVETGAVAAAGQNPNSFRSHSKDIKGSAGWGDSKEVGISIIPQLVTVKR
jgi:hypothetical protein